MNVKLFWGELDWRDFNMFKKHINNELVEIIVEIITCKIFMVIRFSKEQ